MSQKSKISTLPSLRYNAPSLQIKTLNIDAEELSLSEVGMGLGVFINR